MSMLGGYQMNVPGVIKSEKGFCWIGEKAPQLVVRDLNQFGPISLWGSHGVSSVVCFANKSLSLD